MSTPLVSIILPTRNGAMTIKRAIASVYAQTFDSWELIVVDDASTDGVAALVHEYTGNDPRIAVLSNQTNLGLSASLKKAVSHASGAFIARIDDDDEWVDTEKLSLQIAYLDAHPATVLIGTGVIVVDEKGREVTRYLMPMTDRAIRKKMLRMNCFIHSSVLFSKEVAQYVGGYTVAPDGNSFEDYDLWLRIGTHGEMANIPRYSVVYQMKSSGENARNKLLRLAQNIALIKSFQKYYPNYAYSRALRVAERFFYRAYARLPRQVKGWMISLHKRF